MVIAIDDEQEASMMVERQACRTIELPISIACFLGADRELDSSINSKRIVSHLFQLAQNDKELSDQQMIRSNHTRDSHQTPKNPQTQSNTMQQDKSDDAATRRRRSERTAMRLDSRSQSM